LFALLPAAGLRIGEGLGLQIPNVLDNCTRLRIVEKNYNGKQEDRLKTPSGKRTVEVHSGVAAILREHIGDRTTGYVFQNKKGRPLCQSNIIKRYLHPILLGDGETPGVTGEMAGNHAFRRFRNSYLRTKSCPAGLLKYWLGHSRKSDMSDLYDKSLEDSAWRGQMAEQLGIGFTLPEEGRIVPSCTEKTKTATELVAV
jgi:integrase